MKIGQKSFRENRTFSGPIGAFSGPIGAFSGLIGTDSSAPHSRGEPAEIPPKGAFWAQLVPFGLSPRLLSPPLDFPSFRQHKTGEIQKGTGGRGRERQIVVTFYDDLWRFMTNFMTFMSMEQRDGNCHKMSRKLSWPCRKLSWRLSQIVVTFFFPVPFPPSPFGFRRQNAILAKDWELSGKESGPEKGVITKGVFSLEESLESLKSLNSLESLENG